VTRRRGLGLRRGPGLGPEFGKLWTASTISTLGDGIVLTAGPLLAATLTRDPVLISLVGAASYVPWLLFSLPAGALVDRWDRRRVMWIVDLLRGFVLAAVAVTVVTGTISIPVLVVASLALGVGQTLFDNASQAAIPTVVSDVERLERANGQLLGARTVSEQFAGPPLGGYLFSLTAWLPYAADAVTFAASSALLARLRGRFRADPGPVPRASLRAEMVDGLRWLARHRLLRGLAVLAGLGNLVFSAGEAVLVLVAQERLGLGSVGFGLLLTGVAVGGTVGSLMAAWLSRRWGLRRVLLGTRTAESVAVLLVGLTTSAWLAGAALALVGAATAIYNVLVQSLRQAAVPAHLLGRAISAFRLIGLGTIPIGVVLGGLLARIDLRVPFLVGAAVMALSLVVVVRVVTNQSIAAAREIQTEPAG
jgi:MFS family permease